MQNNDDFDDQAQAAWCDAQRQVVTDYLHEQNINHGRIGDWPAWHVTGCVAIWAIQSHLVPESIGWWAISGDLPTDYCSAADIQSPQHPQKAVRVIAKRWLELTAAWQAGRQHPDIKINCPQTQQELLPLLESRAKILLNWANDDTMWLDTTDNLRQRVNAQATSNDPSMIKPPSIDASPTSMGPLIRVVSLRVTSIMLALLGILFMLMSLIPLIDKRGGASGGSAPILTLIQRFGIALPTIFIGLFFFWCAYKIGWPRHGSNPKR